MYILTRSAKPIKDQQRHTGVGRIVKIKMRPMSLYEMNASNGSVSIQDFINQMKMGVQKSTVSIKDLLAHICRGRWPGTIDLSVEQAIVAVENYYHTLTSEDIVDVDNVKRDQTRAKAVIKSFSRNISTLTSYQTMVKDIIEHGDQISDESFYSYIRALEKLYIIDNVPA